MTWLENIKNNIGLSSDRNSSKTTSFEQTSRSYNRQATCEFLRSELSKQNLELSDYTACYALFLGISQLWRTEALEVILDNPKEFQHVIIRTINFFWQQAPDDSCLTRLYKQTNGDLDQIRENIDWKQLWLTWKNCKNILMKR